MRPLYEKDQSNKFPSFLLSRSKYSQLSLNGYQVLVPARRFSVIYDFTVIQTLYKPDTSLRRTVGAGPDGVRLRES